jgi:nucleoside-diphosphate-sugar epimerase
MEEKKRIGILGCGWLGKPLAIDMIARGYEVKASTTTEEKTEEMNAIGMQPFVVSLGQLTKESISFFKVDILIVAITSKDILGYMQLAKIIEASSISKVIFISSTSVYGKLEGKHTEESRLVKSPLTEIEKVFINSPIDTTIIRFGGLVGYNRQPGKFFTGRRVPNPNGVVNLIHRDDCIAVIRAILDKNIAGEIFNACSSDHPNRGAYYSQSSRDLGLSEPLIDQNDPTIVSEVVSDKLEKHTGLRFTLHLD